MANNEVNIDLLFRKGLKDMEVLPPPGVWNDILPVIRRKQRPLIILRSAAVAAILISITFLGYKWSQEFEVTAKNPFVAYEESIQPVDNPLNRGFLRRIPVIVNKITEPERSYAVAESVSNKTNEVSEEIARPDLSYIADASELKMQSDIDIPEIAGSVTGLSRKTAYSPVIFEKTGEIGYDVPKTKVNRWALMAGGASSYYMLPGFTKNEITDQIYSGEQSRISYSGGVGFSYKISRKLSIQSGIYYASVGNEVNGINSFAGFREFDYTKGDHNFEVITSTGLIWTDNSDVFLRDISGNRVITKYTEDVFDPVKSDLSYLSNSLYQNFSYLEMPFILRYKLIDKSIDFNLIGGVSYNFLVSNNVHTVIDGSRYEIGKTEGLNSIMVSSSLGMGFEYSITDKFSLNLEPTFRYYLNPFGDNPGLKIHPYSFGVFSGLSFKF